MSIKSRYEKLVEHHQCTNCGKPLPEGYKLRKCQECLANHREYMKTYSKGRCSQCYCVLPPNYEYKTCKTCRLIKSKKYYAKKESR